MKKTLLFYTCILNLLLLTGCGMGNEPDDIMLSEEEAKKIALIHAELTLDQVTFIKSEVDRDDERINYEIEFYTNDQKEYDYEIDPYTGDILSYDYDVDID